MVGLQVAFHKPGRCRNDSALFHKLQIDLASRCIISVRSSFLSRTHISEVCHEISELKVISDFTTSPVNLQAGGLLET